MSYEPKNYENLIGISGLGEQLLKNHFVLYQGYINNVNKLDATLKAMAKDEKLGTPEFAELNRRFGWEFNGMRLHEYYFENLSKNGGKIDENSELSKKLINEWGSYGAWEKDFKSIGLMRGIGWVILYYDEKRDRLFNVWINEHDVGHLSGAVPLLVMDVFEHAFITDYGLKRADYIEAFFKNINWEAADKRMK